MFLSVKSISLQNDAPGNQWKSNLMSHLKVEWIGRVEWFQDEDSCIAPEMDNATQRVAVLVSIFHVRMSSLLFGFNKET